MLDIGWSELLVIGIVALIVVGPKDLPKLFRSLGQWVGRARGMARDFQRAMNEAADESGVSDIKKSFDKAASVKNMGMDNWENAMPSKSAKTEPASGAAKEEAKPAEAKPAPTKAATAKPAEPKPAATEKPAAKKPAAKKSAPKKAAPKKAVT